jgi:hypothetical protein
MQALQQLLAQLFRQEKLLFAATDEHTIFVKTVRVGE